ncbi:MAG: glycosyl transferase, partial [Bacteroidales bacterium]|nr:glycosyl transferase [Bacteroidales bacterium]
WTFVAASQHILGIRPGFDGLYVDPCIPKQWKEFSVTRKFRNATYHIKVANPNGKSRGVKEMKVDGRLITGNVLPVFNDNQEHNVEITLG